MTRIQKDNFVPTVQHTGTRMAVKAVQGGQKWEDVLS